MLQGILPLVIGIVVLAIVIGLDFILIPSMTNDAIKSTQKFREGSLERARVILSAVSNYWNLNAERDEQERARKRLISKRTAKQQRKNLLVDETKIQSAVEKEVGEAWEPSVFLTVSAWTRRLAYLVLVTGIAVGYYVLTEPVMAVIVGSSQQIPSFYGLLQQTQWLTGVVLVSCIALAGLLIAEHLPQVHVALKIMPFIPNTLKITFLVLTILMFLVDVIAVAALTIVGIDFENLKEFPGLAAVIALVGMVISIALGLWLAFSAMLKNMSGIGWLIIGLLAALVVFLAGAAAAAGNLILRRLYRISQSLGVKPRPSSSEDSGAEGALE